MNSIAAVVVAPRGDSSSSLDVGDQHCMSVRRRARSRGGTFNSKTAWKERLIARCLARATETREELLADVRRRRIAVVRELQCEKTLNSGDPNRVPEESSQPSHAVSSICCTATCDQDTAMNGNLPSKEAHLGKANDFAHSEEIALYESLDEKELTALVGELEAALEEERRKEDEAMLISFANELYLSSQADDDNDLAELEAFESQLRLNDNDLFVLCPVCEKNRLFVNHGTVFCSCGVRINGGAVDNITLDMVRNRLSMLFNDHDQSGCAGKLTFYQHDVLQMGFQFLHVKCQSCELATVAF